MLFSGRSVGRGCCRWSRSGGAAGAHAARVHASAASASRLAAENATSTEIELLAERQDAFEKSDRLADWARINKQCHDPIAGAVRNRSFHGPLEALQDCLALAGRTTFSVGPRNEAAAQEHRQILEAIAAHDPDAAEKAARDHIHSALAARLKMLSAG